MASTRRIICICSGNICRSPMAVAILRQRLRLREIPAVVISGGTLGIQGRRAAEFARRAMAEYSEEAAGHIEEHRSQGVAPTMLEMADHIIIMSTRHEDFVRRHNPKALSRVVRLWEFAEGASPLHKISDPVGQDAQTFRECRDLLDGCLQRWIDQKLVDGDS